MKLYHLTWASNIQSILDDGLVPNCVPNDWVFEDAKKRSKGKTFLCSTNRRQYWRMTYGDGWAGRRKDDKLVWLAIQTDGLNLHVDKEENCGDYWTTQCVPAARIKVLDEPHKRSALFGARGCQKRRKRQ